METFEKLNQLYTEHNISWSAFRTAIANYRDVVADNWLLLVQTTYERLRGEVSSDV